MMELRFDVAGRINKPVDEVFEAVVDPGQLSGYFATAGARGRMETGTTVEWTFPEYREPVPVDVIEVVENERIVLEWDAEPHPGLPSDLRTRTTMLFEALEGERTLIRIHEEGWPPTDAGLRSSYEHNGGWMQMLCSLKAKLEYDVRLRDGMWA